MTDEKQNSRTLADKIIEHIERDITLNQKLSGIDFSGFFGTIIGVFTSAQFTFLAGADDFLYQKEIKEKRDNYVFMTLNLINVERQLGAELGKMVRFQNAREGLAACVNLPSYDEFDRVDEYARGLLGRSHEALTGNVENMRVNNLAVKYFTHMRSL